MFIFDHQKQNNFVASQSYLDSELPKSLLRTTSIELPCKSEPEVVRHYTRLSRKNICIETAFYPLGSCTMKYNPRAAHKLASLADNLARHPLAPLAHSQGFLQTLYELQIILAEITGMKAVSLTPMAGAQGELAGVAMIRAYHESRGDRQRTEIIVPTAAHGTNPATAAMCGFKVKEIPITSEGDVDVAALEKVVGPQTAGIMLTNPSTLGVFERQIEKIARIIHQAGGLLYYDGANLNAILGRVRPGDMGFDVMHMNLHKTFATPHGGGGPGSGPIAVSERLKPFLPTPIVTRDHNDYYHWLSQKDYPQSIGRLSAFMGNAGVLLRAYIYIRMLGRSGMIRVSQFATLNANYLMKRLQAVGYTIAFPTRRASHEFIITLQPQTKAFEVTATDVAKRLLDYGFHAPTTYFPLIVPQCLLIEPTETESKHTLDQFVEAMAKILQEAEQTPDLLHQAPHSLALKRLDDVKAVKILDIVYSRQSTSQEQTS